MQSKSHIVLSTYSCSSQAAGFVEGQAAGRDQGVREGQRLGWEKGAAIGSEVKQTFLSLYFLLLLF